DAELDRVNRDLMARVNARKRVYLTGTLLRGRFAIRICVLSFRTHRDRMEMALQDLRAAVAETPGTCRSQEVLERAPIRALEFDRIANSRSSERRLGMRRALAILGFAVLAVPALAQQRVVDPNGSTLHLFRPKDFPALESHAAPGARSGRNLV